MMIIENNYDRNYLSFENDNEGDDESTALQIVDSREPFITMILAVRSCMMLMMMMMTITIMVMTMIVIMMMMRSKALGV